MIQIMQKNEPAQARCKLCRVKFGGRYDTVSYRSIIPAGSIFLGYRVVCRCEARLRKLASGTVCGDGEVLKVSYVGRQTVDSGTWCTETNMEYVPARAPVAWL